MSEFKEINCKKCGGKLKEKNGIYVCLSCGTNWEKDDLKSVEENIKSGLRSVLSEEEEKKLANLRVNLWDEIDARIKDLDAIKDICERIREIEPDDLYAKFFIALSSDNLQKIRNFLYWLEDHVVGNEKLLDVVFDNLFSEATSLDNASFDLIAEAIEKAYFEKDATVFSKYNGELERMRTDANAGFYSPETPRDAFLCYAHKDIDAVRNLIDFLENKKGLKCFAAYRNLAKTFGQKHDYKAAIKTAIDNSKVFVFLSSDNSRDLNCDALSLECAYIDELDKKGIHKPRVEYCFENNYTVATEADRRIKHVFDGLQRVFHQSGVYQVIKDLNDKQILEKAAAEAKAKSEAEEREKAEQERIKREAEEREKAEAEHKAEEVAEWNQKGEDYYYGKNGVAQNYSEAVKWYKKSAEQGDSDAQYNLGYCYEKGQGVEKDYTEAVKWYKKSAEQGDAAAIKKLKELKVKY